MIPFAIKISEKSLAKCFILVSYISEMELIGEIYIKMGILSNRSNQSTILSRRRDQLGYELGIVTNDQFDIYYLKHDYTITINS